MMLLALSYDDLALLITRSCRTTLLNHLKAQVSVIKSLQSHYDATQSATLLLLTKHLSPRRTPQDRD